MNNPDDCYEKSRTKWMYGFCHATPLAQIGYILSEFSVRRLCLLKKKVRKKTKPAIVLFLSAIALLVAKSRRPSINLYRRKEATEDTPKKSRRPGEEEMKGNRKVA
jgi:hypothetical protein